MFPLDASLEKKYFEVKQKELSLDNVYWSGRDCDTDEAPCTQIFNSALLVRTL